MKRRRRAILTDRWLALTDVVAYTGLSQQAIAVLRSAGNFPVGRLLRNRHPAWQESALKAWIESLPEVH